MKIRKLMVEDFGKFHQEEFVLGEHLNVATGANESGKTTLRHFLCAMWYGLERERGLKARKDEYTRYKPWYSGRFQGSMELEADGVPYRLSRNFLTKEVRLLNLESGREVEAPEEFLRERGLASEAIYRNTFWVGNECRTEDVLAENFKNHMANFAHTGGMNLNLHAAEEHLKKQKREIEKNIPEREILECMEQAALRRDLENRWRTETEQLGAYEKDYAAAEQRLDTCQAEMEELRLAIKEAEKKQLRQQKGEWILLLMVVLGVLLWGVCGGLFSVFSLPGQNVIQLLGIGAIVLGLAVSLPLILLNRGHGRKGLEEQGEALQRKILSSYEAVKALLPVIEKGRLLVEQTEEKLQACSAAEKRYEVLLQQKESLWKELDAVSLAQKTLEEIAIQLYNEYGAGFYKKMSDYVKDFTDRTYERLVADEELNLSAITEDRTVEVTDVSHGTGEQFYLALRFAAADVFDPEKENPIILDDSFVAFDEQRLESALLALERSGRQIIIFSSTGREEQTLRRMGVTYEKIFEKTRKGHMERD